MAEYLLKTINFPTHGPDIKQKCGAREFVFPCPTTVFN